MRRILTHNQEMENERQPLLSNMSDDTGKDAGILPDPKPPEEGLSPEPQEAIKRKNKFIAVCKHFLSNITLEPMLFVKMVAEGNYKVVADTLEIERICRVTLNQNASDCDAMDDGQHTDLQNDVQRFQNTFNFHQSLMDSLIPLVVVLFLGPLSDRYGRKPAMASVLTGFVLLSIVYTLTALNPTWPVQVLYLGTFLVDIGGTWVVFNMAVYSYIADITSTESRTKRMGFADAVWYTGSPVGTLMGGFVYKRFGYGAVFITSGILWALCLLYTVFLMKESRSPNAEDSEINWYTARCGPVGYIGALFKTIFKKRSGNGRFHLFVLIGIKLGVFLVQGHQGYLWARKVLQWDATRYSTWTSAEDESHQLGMVGWVWIAEKAGFHDCTTANGGLVSIMLWSVTLACITGPSLWWLTIVASILGLLEASIEPALRSMITATVGSGEEGRVLTLLGLLESAWFSVDRAIYTSLYNSYIEVFPQIDFVVQASIAFILIWIVFLLKKSLQKNVLMESVEATSYQHSHHL